MAPSAKPITQAAALPFVRKKKELEVLLVTSRRDGRWTLPKGWIDDDEEPAEAARREAFEEAGVSGSVHPKAIGDYNYLKVLSEDETVLSRVHVYAMRVDDVRDSWPEVDARERLWVPLSDAAKHVGDKDAARFLRRLARKDGSALRTVADRLKS